MRISLLLLALSTAACALPPRDAANAPSVAPSPELAATQSPMPEPAATTPPEATSAPSARLESPSVAVAATAFPIVPSLALHAAPIDKDAEGAVQRGLAWYRDSLDGFRESGASAGSRRALAGR